MFIVARVVLQLLVALHDCIKVEESTRTSVSIPAAESDRWIEREMKRDNLRAARSGVEDGDENGGVSRDAYCKF